MFGTVSQCCDATSILDGIIMTIMTLMMVIMTMMIIVMIRALDIIIKTFLSLLFFAFTSA